MMVDLMLIIVSDCVVAFPDRQLATDINRDFAPAAQVFVQMALNIVLVSGIVTAPVVTSC